MLKQRLFTALILIPIAVLCILFLSPPHFCLVMGLIALWGAWEWSAFIGLTTLLKRLGYLLLIVAMLIAALFRPIPIILYITFIAWILATGLIMAYPKGSNVWGKSLILRGLMGVFVLVPTWLAINFIRTAENGPFILLFLFILIWGADIGAYFAGKKWGAHKLCPHVSPGKTWEGLAGAVVTGMIISVLGLLLGKTPYFIWPGALLLALITILFSVIGDLFESMLKRNVGLKDSGVLLPGHGGLLDRIDSLTAAAPIFALGAMLLGRYYL